MLPSVRIEPDLQLTSDSKSNAFYSELIRHVLLKESLNFCLCTTWFLELDDLVRVNTAWLYKQPKVSILQANAQLTQKGEWRTWDPRLIRSLGSILTWGNIFFLDFFVFT